MQLDLKLGLATGTKAQIPNLLLTTFPGKTKSKSNRDLDFHLLVQTMITHYGQNTFIYTNNFMIHIHHDSV